MSLLTEQQIEKFQYLWEQKFGTTISKEEAYEQGVKLVRLVELVCKKTIKK